MEFKNIILFFGDSLPDFYHEKELFLSKFSENKIVKFSFNKFDYTKNNDFDTSIIDLYNCLNNRSLWSTPIYIEFNDFNLLSLDVNNNSTYSFSKIIQNLFTSNDESIRVIFKSDKKNYQQLPESWKLFLNKVKNKYITKTYAQPIFINDQINWVDLYAKKLKLDITKSQIQLIINLNSFNQQKLMNLLTKLSLIKSNTISNSHIYNLSDNTLDQAIFKINNAIINNDINSIISLINHLENNRSDTIAVFNLFIYQWRKLYKISILQKNNVTLNQASKYIKDPTWMLKKNWSLAKNIYPEQIIYILRNFNIEDLKTKYLKDSANHSLVIFCNKVLKLLSGNKNKLSIFLSAIPN